MTWRGLAILMCGSAFAQLPRSQAPMPRDIPYAQGRIDTSVTDADGRPIPDLKAADFTLEASGKPQKIESSEYENDQPLRLAVLIDDLSLPIERLNAVKRALRDFVRNGLKDGDEMAILRAGAGSGGTDAFTADKSAIEAAIDRARFNPESGNSTAQSFGAGPINVMRGVIEGLRESAGRKVLLLVSERFGEKERAVAAGKEHRLSTLAHRASTVLYAFDAAPVQQPALDQGFATLLKDTGGRVFDSGDLATALGRIAREQRAYYVLTFGGEDLGFDYIARTPQVEKVALHAARPGAVVRARNGFFGFGGGSEDIDGDFGKCCVDSDRLEGGIRAKLTAMWSMGTGWQVEAIVHVDARDLTFVKGPDNLYRTRFDTAAALLDPQGTSAKNEARSFQAQLDEATWARYQTQGFDYSVTLPLPGEGAYQVYSAVRDSTSGRIGTTRQFLRATDFKDGKLVMSSIVVRGEIEKNAQGVDALKDPLESGSVRSFKTGHRVTYAYSLFNVGADAEKRSEIETHSEIWRDGVRIYDAEPKPVAFPPAENSGTRSVSGVLSITESMAPGVYILRVTVTDKVTKRIASQWMDFEVRP